MFVTTSSNPSQVQPSLIFLFYDFPVQEKNLLPFSAISRVFPLIITVV